MIRSKGKGAVGKTAVRGYSSELREHQTEETRARILDATVRVMATGLASVSVPAVAREAGVSIPTVYRHFGTKRDLLAALYPHIAQRIGLDRVEDPRSLEDLREGIRTIFDRLDALDDLARAAVASPAAEEVRHFSMPDRFERIRGFVDSIAPRLSKVDRARLARLLVILTTSSAMRVWRDHLGSSVDEAADDIDWVARLAIASTSRGKR